MSSKPWPKNPSIYEINTWVWLNTLSERYKRPITLRNVPDEVVDELATYRADAIWMMGVWHRGPATRASALNYIHEYRGALADITEEDVVGSAYAVGGYTVDEHLGGQRGLAAFRKQLQRRGLRLILDFVPNHVATDHPWVSQHPDYFVQGSDAQREDADFFLTETAGGQDMIVAHGRDPYFPGWIDTAQLNAFSPGYRAAAVQILRELATQCDGVRCDMAMLLATPVFENTWGWLGVQPLAEEFWREVIPQVKQRAPQFLFIAEVYWGLDYEMQQQGFDYTYDKTLYDRLVAGDIGGVYDHLLAELSFSERNVRFIENHDEPRAADSFGVERSRPAAVLTNTVPGAVLLHDGQFTGRVIKLPVQIARQPDEDERDDLKAFYLRLLHETSSSIYRTGQWRLLQRHPACAHCTGHTNIIAYAWRNEDEYRLIAVNLSHEWSTVSLDAGEWMESLTAHDWHAYDGLSDSFTEYHGAIMAERGIVLELPAYQSCVYRLTKKTATSGILQRAKRALGSGSNGKDRRTRKQA